jgi:uncharacterized SAM-binding protein YcdF (DUF218 family)
MKGFLVIAALLMLWLAGLMTFAHKTQDLTPAHAPRHTDAIVTLTGASDERLRAAMALLQDGRGERLLVTGVDKKVTRAELRAVMGGPKRLYLCCVDLGFRAADTMGNAAETAAWAKARDIDSLIVVTADYHMPRALVELRARLPHVRLYAYAIKTPVTEPKNWLREGFAGPRLVLEYCKYLVIRAREEALHLGARFESKKAT